MEYNIERSSSVSMFKKQRKLDDGKVVWDSVVKLRKKSPAHCSKYPPKHLGIRNSWITEFSNTLSEKASSYVLGTMSAERTSRQEEIAQTLFNRFNGFLEQEASMTDPQTLTHKAMLVVADKLSVWLDKNVQVSKNVGVRIRKMEEKEKKKKLMEEIERLEQGRKDDDEQKKQKMAEPKSAHDAMRPPPETEPETKPPEVDENNPATDPEPDTNKLQETEDDYKFPEKDDDKPPDEGSHDAQPAEDQELQPPSPTSDLTDHTPTTKGPTDEEEIAGTQQVTGNSQGETMDNTGTQEGKVDDIDDKEEEKLNHVDQHDAEKEVPSDDKGKTSEGPVEDDTGTLKPSPEEEVITIKSEDFVEPDISKDSPIHNILDIQDVGEELTAGAPEDSILSNHDALDVTQTPLDTIDETVIPPEEAELPYDSIQQSSSSDVSYRDGMNIEPSEDSATLVKELLGSSMGEEGTDLVDVDLNLIGKSVDKTDIVLHELAEIIARTNEEHSPLQEAIKDIMEKELENRLGDEDVGIINEVAGKVGTWMDKMVERAAEEYGERRSPPPVRSMPPRAVSLPKGSFGAPRKPEVLPQASILPSTSLVPKAPVLKAAVPPEGLAEPSFETAEISSQPPVSQKPKGPIFELRKVDTKNIFNVAGITHTKAKRKIREARGHSTSSSRVSQESLDIEEWAEWAGLVSDVGQNWAKWIEDVAQGVEGPNHNNNQSFSYDAREWRSINKELQREGDVWMKKVIRKQSKQKSGRTAKTNLVSA